MQDFTNEIDNALDLLYKLEKQPSKKKNLLDKGKNIYLQVVLFKIPFGAPRKRKFLKLRHSLYGDDPEICLFVPNIKTGVEYKKSTDELIDFCVDHYTELLEKHKIEGITTVMPLKQLRSEYGTYDLKRKLVHRFDLFLCKNSLLYNSRFLTSLGKIFRVANKEPLGISFPKKSDDFDPEFQKSLERAILTSSFFINRFSDNYSIPIGRAFHTKEELKENLKEVLNQILSENIIPGGLKNIRAMYLWPSQSKPIPLYMSSEFPADLKKPRVESNRKRKREKGVEGELSSFPNKKVFVTSSGEVFITKLKKEPKYSDPESDDSFKDESDEEEEEKQVSLKTKIQKTGDEEESESEDDEQIEKNEARLMGTKIKEEEESDGEEEDEEEEEEEENAKVGKRVKGKSKGIKNKSKKGKEKKGKINKSKRKSNMKEEKYKLKEIRNQKKLKQKKTSS